MKKLHFPPGGDCSWSFTETIRQNAMRLSSHFKQAGPACVFQMAYGICVQRGEWWRHYIGYRAASRKELNSSPPLPLAGCNHPPPQWLELDSPIIHLFVNFVSMLAFIFRRIRTFSSRRFSSTWLRELLIEFMTLSVQMLLQYQHFLLQNGTFLLNTF
jgi:hypothetical protein